MIAWLALDDGTSALGWTLLTPEGRKLVSGQVGTLGPSRNLYAESPDREPLEDRGLPTDAADDAPLRALLGWLAEHDWTVRGVLHRLPVGEGEPGRAALLREDGGRHAAQLRRLLPSLPQLGVFDSPYRLFSQQAVLRRLSGLLDEPHPFALLVQLRETPVVSLWQDGKAIAQELAEESSIPAVILQLAERFGPPDALVFTGEQDADRRARYAEALGPLGIALEPLANRRHFPRIGTAESALPVLALPDEAEGEMLRLALPLLQSG